MTTEHLRSLAADPQLMPYLLHEARKIAAESDSVTELRGALEALQLAKSNLSPSVRYFTPGGEAELLVDRTGLMAELEEAERMVTEAIARRSKGGAS